MNILVQAGLGLAAAASAAIVLLTFERPPVETVQRGFRGTGMELVHTPRALEALAARNIPPPVTEPVEPAGIKASEVYENVPVLGDLDVAEFNRLMIAITAWVSPEQGCAYCHNVENMASDEVYTKIVTRRMLQMTKAINTQWSSHVQETGVTCYTCHRGQPVPAYVWATLPTGRSGMLPATGVQNMVATEAGLSSLPADPFTAFFQEALPIRVHGTTPHGPNNRTSIQQAEWTYSLMMHFSQATGQNCTWCHNSQNFASWRDAPQTRVTSWHGIRMVRDINNIYITPLAPLWRANPQGPPEAGTAANVARLGPLGDPLKVSCATCHQGAFKPLLGAQMLREYQALNAASLSPLQPSAAALTPR